MGDDSNNKPGPPPVPPSLARHHRKVMKVRQVMAGLTISILCAAAVIAIFGILSEEGVGALLVKLFYTGCISLGYSSISYAYLSKSLKSTSFSGNMYGVSLGGVGALIFIVLLWVDLDPEIIAKIILIALVTALAAINMIGLAGLGIAQQHNWIRQCSHLLSALMVLAASYLIIEEPKESNPWKYTGVLLVLTVLVERGPYLQ